MSAHRRACPANDGGQCCCLSIPLPKPRRRASPLDTGETAAPKKGDTVDVEYTLLSLAGGIRRDTVTVAEVEPGGKFFRSTTGHRYEMTTIVHPLDCDCDGCDAKREAPPDYEEELPTNYAEWVDYAKKRLSWLERENTLLAARLNFSNDQLGFANKYANERDAEITALESEVARLTQERADARRMEGVAQSTVGRAEKHFAALNAEIASLRSQLSAATKVVEAAREAVNVWAKDGYDGDLTTVFGNLADSLDAATKGEKPDTPDTGTTEEEGG